MVSMAQTSEGGQPERPSDRLDRLEAQAERIEAGMQRCIELVDEINELRDSIGHGAATSEVTA